MMTVPAMLKSARLVPIAATPKTAALTASDPPSRAHGAHRGSLPAVSDAAGAEATAVGVGVGTVMSVRYRELGAAGDDPSRQRVDREGHDEEDEAGRDERVDSGAVRFGEG